MDEPCREQRADAEIDECPVHALDLPDHLNGVSGLELIQPQQTGQRTKSGSWDGGGLQLCLLLIREPALVPQRLIGVL